MEGDDGMEGGGSLNTRNSLEVCNLRLHFVDMGLILGLDSVIIVRR